LTPKGSKFHHSFKSSLEDLYADHIDKYKSSVVVAFGTTFFPSDYTVNRILDTAEKMPDIGFIFAMKDPV